MKFYKSAMLVAAMLLGFSTLVSAGSVNVNKKNKGGCGDGGSPSLCNNPQDYSATFDAKVDNKDNMFGSYAYINFEAINEPTLEISSVKLSVKSNADFGAVLKLYSYYPYISFIGVLDGGVDVFSISSSLFDDVLDGLSLTAIFSKWEEDVFWAKLTIDGTYCPPVSEVPVPAALWLFGSGLMGFTAMRRRKKTA